MIFGSGSAYFTSNSESISLEYSNMVPDYLQSDYVDFKSVINGVRTYVGQGDYSKFKVQVHLYKYPDPIAKFKEIYNYNHKDVVFYPHSDGKTLYSESGSIVNCHITEMSLSYLDDLNFRDLLTITFETTGYVYLASSSL